ncbi:hypothetical protein Tco_0074602 [Tanacetum coccineum]
MSIGFKEYTSNGEIKVTLYQEDHKALCNKMDVAVEEKTPITETRVVDSTLKVNLDQFIAYVMHIENMFAAIESHSSEPYQIMNLSEENPVKVNDTTSLKIGFCVVGRKKKPGGDLQSPYEQQQSTTPPPAKRRTITSQILESIEFPDEFEVDGEEEEKFESIKFSGVSIVPFSEVTLPCYIKALLESKE